MQGESDEIRIINLLKEINLRIGALLSRFYDRYGLTPVQAAVALALYEHGQQNITDLCALMGCGKSNLSPLCRRLERRGFVERVRDEEDQRVVHIRLTAAALDSVSELHRAVKAGGFSFRADFRKKTAASSSQDWKPSADIFRSGRTVPAAFQKNRLK